MSSLLILFQLFNLHQSITWKSSTSLPDTLAKAAYGVNANKTLMYMLGGMTSNLEHFKNIYQFNGTDIIEIGKKRDPIQPFACDNQCSTTVNDIIFYTVVMNDYINYIIGWNTTSLNNQYNISVPSEIKQKGNDFDFCLTSNNTYLMFLVTVQLDSKSFGNTIKLYNILKQKWFPENKLANSTWLMVRTSCGFYDNTLYSFGGSFQQGARGYNTYDNKVSAYDFSTDTWTLMDVTLPQSIYYAATIAPKHDGIFYIMGGQMTKSNSNTVCIFDANTGKISSTSPLLINATQSMIGFFDSKIFILGGIADTQYIETSEESNALPTVHPTVSPVPSPTHHPSTAPTTTELPFTNTQIIIGAGALVGLCLICCLSCWIYYKFCKCCDYQLQCCIKKRSSNIVNDKVYRLNTPKYENY